MRYSKGQDNVLKIFWFLLSPITSLVLSWRSLNTKSTYVIIFLFCILFGLAFTPDINSTLDSVYYANYFKENGSITWSEFYNDFEIFISYQKGKKDFYLHTATFIVSRFTSNVHFLFGFFAVVFSFFYLKSFKYLTFDKSYKNTLLCFILAAMFTISNPIFNINGVRFWTAAWIGVYCVFKIIEDRKYFYILLLLLTPFIHATFWLLVGVLILYFCLKGYSKTLVYLFIFSFFLSSFVFEFIGDLSSVLPPILQRYLVSYGSEDAVSNREAILDNASWFMKPFLYGQKWYLNGLILIFIKESKLFRGRLEWNLLMFVLVLGIIVNLGQSIPSLGVRYALIMYPFIAFLWQRVILGTGKYNWMLYLFPVVFFMDIFHLMTRIFIVLDPMFYVSPPFYFLYYILDK